MLGGDALRGRDRCLRERRCGCWRLRWCGLAGGTSVHLAEALLGQRRRAKVDSACNFVLTLPLRGTGEVGTIASTIGDVVDGLAVGLAGDFGLATFKHFY